MNDHNTLEERVKKRVLPRTPPSQVLEEIRQGKKFIIVDNDFDPNYIPLSYMLIDMRYKNTSFKTLVPQNLLFYLANPGEGDDLEDALDEITDFYDEVKDFEEENIENGNTSIQGTNWAVTARSSYRTYLINTLTKASKGDADVPEWNTEALEALDLNDNYVAHRVKAIAAIALGKSVKEVKKYGVGDVLRHVTINERKTENLSAEEFNKVACHCGSHYELKDEYRNDPNVEYHINSSLSSKTGTKTTKKKDVEVFDAKIDQLEKEIEMYRREKHGTVGRHDQNKIRMVANLEYIAKENPDVQLPVTPPDKK